MNYSRVSLKLRTHSDNLPEKKVKNPFENPFFVAILVLVIGFVAMIWGGYYIIGLFAGSEQTWWIILAILVAVLVRMQFRRTLTPHEAHDRLLQILEPPDLRDARLRSEGRREDQCEEPANR